MDKPKTNAKQQLAKLRLDFEEAAYIAWNYDDLINTTDLVYMEKDGCDYMIYFYVDEIIPSRSFPAVGVELYQKCNHRYECGCTEEMQVVHTRIGVEEGDYIHTHLKELIENTQLVELRCGEKDPPIYNKYLRIPRIIKPSEIKKFKLSKYYNRIISVFDFPVGMYV